MAEEYDWFADFKTKVDLSIERVLQGAYPKRKIEPAVKDAIFSILLKIPLLVPSWPLNMIAAKWLNEKIEKVKKIEKNLLKAKELSVQLYETERQAPDKKIKYYGVNRHKTISMALQKTRMQLMDLLVEGNRSPSEEVVSVEDIPEKIRKKYNYLDFQAYLKKRVQIDEYGKLTRAGKWPRFKRASRARSRVRRTKSCWCSMRRSVKTPSTRPASSPSTCPCRVSSWPSWTAAPRAVSSWAFAISSTFRSSS